MKVFGYEIDEATIAAALDEAFATNGTTKQDDLARILRERGVAAFDLEAACRIFAREKKKGTVMWDGPERVWRKIEVWGSGNVFADLGLPDPAVRLAKAEAAIAIADAIREHGLTIEEAATISGMEPGRLRGIVDKGRTDGVSLERLDRIYEAIEAWEQGRKP